MQKPTQRENRCFVKLTTRPPCKYIYKPTTLQSCEAWPATRSYKNHDVEGDLLFRQVRRRQVWVQARHASKGWVSLFRSFLLMSLHWAAPRQAGAQDALHVWTGVEKPWGSAEPWVNTNNTLDYKGYQAVIHHITKCCWPLLLQVGSLHAAWAWAAHSSVQVPPHPTQLSLHNVESTSHTISLFWIIFDP